MQWCSFWYEQKRKFWKSLYNIILMRHASYFQDWGMLGEVYCAYSESCTQSPALKWKKKKKFWSLLIVCAQASFSCSRLTLALLHSCCWHNFGSTLWFQDFLKVAFLSYKMILHVALAGIFLGMWREEMVGDRDHTIISVFDVVPHKFMLTQCRDCRAYCEEAHHLFSASALL